MSTDSISQPVEADAVAQALVTAATAGGYAPSIHNTQPWRWRVAAGALDLFIERSRSLDVTDPDLRLATLSCGAALHHARTSLAVQGWHVSVARMPDRGDGDHLAQLRVDRRVPVDSVAVLHAWAVKLRHTDRRPLTGPPVGARQLEAIRAAVENEHTWLHMLTRDQVLDLASAADHAQRALADESPWRAELAYWTGGRRPTGSGIPDSAIPAEATETTVATRDFGHRGDLPVSAEHDKSAGYAMLYGNADEPFDWLCAGEALSAAWLTATEQGVSVVPLSAPIEVVGTRQAMRTIIASVGYPYLMLRLGMVDPSDGWQPHTPRLPANQIIDG